MRLFRLREEKMEEVHLFLHRAIYLVGGNVKLK